MIGNNERDFVERFAAIAAYIYVRKRMLRSTVTWRMGQGRSPNVSGCKDAVR